jgi:hypothetical protein
MNPDVNFWVAIRRALILMAGAVEKHIERLQRRMGMEK